MPRGFAGFEEPEHWLTFDEIERVTGAFAALGVRRLRLTGGEPLLRRGAGEDELADAIRGAIELKPERHEFRDRRNRVVRIMAQTGG